MLPYLIYLIYPPPPPRPYLRKFLGLDDDEVFVGVGCLVAADAVGCWWGLSRSARGRHRQSPAAEFRGIRGGRTERRIWRGYGERGMYIVVRRCQFSDRDGFLSRWEPSIAPTSIAPRGDEMNFVPTPPSLSDVTPRRLSRCCNASDNSSFRRTLIIFAIEFSRNIFSLLNSQF